MAELLLVLLHSSRRVGHWTGSALPKHFFSCDACRWNGSRLPTSHTASTPRPVSSNQIEDIGSRNTFVVIACGVKTIEWPLVDDTDLLAPPMLMPRLHDLAVDNVLQVVNPS